MKKDVRKKKLNYYFAKNIKKTKNKPFKNKTEVQERRNLCTF